MNYLVQVKQAAELTEQDIMAFRT